ncbi:MAG: hypothetical protein B7Z08_12030 [Sphingomonadales bacterium 32-68-7]|nr:MAG: hypothetical protein B7Z08_12030 [Sphingomonadales bacterium 32-68-7]
MDAINKPIVLPCRSGGTLRDNSAPAEGKARLCPVISTPISSTPANGMRITGCSTIASASSASPITITRASPKRATSGPISSNCAMSPPAPIARNAKPRSFALQPKLASLHRP